MIRTRRVCSRASHRIHGFPDFHPYFRFLVNDFTTIGGQARNRIARLDPTTGLADSFNPNANDRVYSMVVQADGKILVGGPFTAIGRLVRNRIARLDPTTGLADSFNPSANGEVVSIAVQADGKILVGGSFTAIGGQARNGIARLDPTTGLPDSFDPKGNTFVLSIAVQTDGKILVGGLFAFIGGQVRNRIARLDPTTGLADSFDPNANADVLSIAVQADGKILVGGFFTAISGQTRNRIARLDPTTGLADSFNPNANNSVFSIAAQPDGKVLVGGVFNGTDSIGGQERSLFARLNNDTVAQQELAVSQTSITWIRSGSSPQCIRVTFEDSTDNLSYNFLGHGTAVGSNWTLAGLNLSVGQNLYIRARGYYPGGLFNGSESITESVRHAFLTPSLAIPQPFLNIQRNANTNAVLLWGTNFTGFTLEASTDLNSDAWSVASPAPAVRGTNLVVTNTVSGLRRFYRLRR